MEDLRENIDEEFFEKGEIYAVNGNPTEAAGYLVNLLKSKEMVPDEIFNQLYLAFTFASTDIVVQAISLLQALNLANAQAIISKKLVKALAEVTHPQPFNKPFLAEEVMRKWKEFDPECLGLLFSVCKIEIPKEE